jgi:hypothetical protein
MAHGAEEEPMDSLASVAAAVRTPRALTPVALASQPTRPLNRGTFVAAVAELSQGARLVAEEVVRADTHELEIRVSDPVTHRVVTANPSESLAALRRDLAAYQRVGVPTASASGGKQL